jgi:RNA polymerase sigma factor (sigma-70 family)
MLPGRRIQAWQRAIPRCQEPEFGDREPEQMPSKVETIRETTAGLAEMHGKFLQFLRRRLNDGATAEDILQTAYLKAMRHEAELRDTESSVAWFYRILRNAVIDHYRQMAARSRAMDQLLADWQEDYDPPLQHEVCACIREAVRDLKPEYRMAIERVDLGDDSVEAFAEAQKLTANHAYVRLHRARKVVAKRLIEVCGTCATHRCVDCSCKHGG